MTVFESFKTKNIDELAEWLGENCAYDSAPWSTYFDNKYCKNCECEIGYVSDYHNKEMEFSYCELYGKCRFFGDMDIDDVLDDKHMVKLWLESEVSDGA